MGTIGVACKDKGPASTMARMASELRSRSHEVFVVTEGLASAVFRDAGVLPDVVGPVRVEEPWDFDAEEYLNSCQVQLLLTAAGLPMRTERALAQAANNIGIPVVHFEDHWGNEWLLEADIALALVLDANAAQRVPAQRAVIVGNPAVPGEPVQPSEAARHYIAKLSQNGERRVCVYLGSGDQTTGELHLLDACLHRSGSMVAIPCLHQKWMEVDGGHGRKLGEIWEEFTKSSPVFVERPAECATRDLVLAADVVVGSHSTDLVTAVSVGKPTVCLQTQYSMQRYTANYLNERYPLIDAGLVHHVTTSCDLRALLAQELPGDRSILKPFDMQSALEAIEECLYTTRRRLV